MDPAQLPPAEDPDAKRFGRSAEGQQIPLVERIENQRFWLRWIIVLVALVMLACLSWMEFVVVRNLLESGFSETDNLFMVLAVSPIVAATTIIVFLVIGAFRSFKEADMGNLPVEAIARGTTYSSHSP